jgi:crotonobetainyl-CoA:carnitine CoA-transferase CaiB-like acyl-CoA transferase
MQTSNTHDLGDGPLSGVRVLDFTSVVVGPVATQSLADYGADVIKIEAPGGDLLRRMGGQSRSGELSPKFIQMNRNKRSLAIDLRTDEGRATVRTLMRGADVVVVNMRGPALLKLGLTYEDARNANESIIHCAMMGFGKKGRYFGKPAYDTIIQGGAGVAACNERLTGAPQFVPMVLADHLVALIAVQMILLALRARDLTGESQAVEVPMFENVASFVLQEHIGQKAFVPERGETGDRRIFDANARPAKTKDGYLCISANTDAQVGAFFEAIGRPELMQDRRFESVEARLRNVSAFFQIRNESLETNTTAQWLALFDELDVPAFQYNTLESLLDDPHLHEVGLFQTMDYAEEGIVKHIGPANTFTGGQRQNPLPSPMLGEHSAEISAEFGFSPTQISKHRGCKSGYRQLCPYDQT